MIVYNNKQCPSIIHSSRLIFLSPRSLLPMYPHSLSPYLFHAYPFLLFFSLECLRWSLSLSDEVARDLHRQLLVAWTVVVALVVDVDLITRR